MNISKLKMPPKNAWNAYREYRKAIGKAGNQNDKTVMAAYKALAKKKTVIDLVQVIRETGEFSNHMPKLAIARADYAGKVCFCWRNRWGDVVFDIEGSLNYNRRNSTTRIRNRFFGFSDLRGRNFEELREVEAKATIPLIPPQIRPPDSMLNKYWILWEAVWKIEPPKDPILLKHLGENLYAVVAEWDLTPIEQAILRR